MIWLNVLTELTELYCTCCWWAGQHLGKESPPPESHIGLAHTDSSTPMFWDRLDVEKGKGWAAGERGHSLDSG